MLAHPVRASERPLTLLALQDESQHQQAWARGAAGEEQVAKLLAKYLDDDVVVLHDRRIPGSRANIDHIAVAPSGVWVIDAKRCEGKATIDRPLLGKPRLLINRRDQAKLIDGLDRQVVLVRTAMAQIAPETPTRGALCFVDTDLPLIRPLTLSGYPLLYPRALAKRINRTGPAGDGTVNATAAALASIFVAA
jgi:Nuclease-related domain